MIPARALARGTQLVLGAGRAAAPRPQIGRDPAQQLARRELARFIYQPSPQQRILHAISDLVQRLLGAARADFPGGWWALAAVAAAAALIVSVIFVRIRPSRARLAAGAVLPAAGRSARHYRQEAQRLAATGDYAAAIVESMRAIAVELEERGLLAPRAGRTAGELAAEAAGPLPGSAAELSAAARLFDDVRYGEHPGSEAGYQRLRQLDDIILAVRQATALTGIAAGPPA